MYIILDDYEVTVCRLCHTYTPNKRVILYSPEKEIDPVNRKPYIQMIDLLSGKNVIISQPEIDNLLVNGVLL